MHTGALRHLQTTYVELAGQVIGNNVKVSRKEKHALLPYSYTPLYTDSASRNRAGRSTILLCCRFFFFFHFLAFAFHCSNAFDRRGGGGGGGGEGAGEGDNMINTAHTKHFISETIIQIQR